MIHYTDEVLDISGNAISGALIHVYSAGTTDYVTLYSDNASTVTGNPQTTNAEGEFSFYIPNGNYRIRTVSGTAIDDRDNIRIGLHEESVNLGADSAINPALGQCFYKTITATTTFTVTNVPASGTIASFILDLTNGGSQTVNWWSGVTWAGGVAPTLTTAGRDALGFYTYDGGTTWTGLVLGYDVKAVV